MSAVQLIKSIVLESLSINPFFLIHYEITFIIAVRFDFNPFSNTLPLLWDTCTHLMQKTLI